MASTSSHSASLWCLWSSIGRQGGEGGRHTDGRRAAHSGGGRHLQEEAQGPAEATTTWRGGMGCELARQCHGADESRQCQQQGGERTSRGRKRKTRAGGSGWGKREGEGAGTWARLQEDACAEKAADLRGRRR
jgi:hypothetical protein